MIVICLLTAPTQVEGTVAMGELLAGCHVRVTPDLLISSSGPPEHWLFNHYLSPRVHVWR